jgi:mannitol 2-dehydrogenase
MPFELMKLRLLNAGHSAMAYFSFLAGFEMVDTAMADPLVYKYCRNYMD